ncbi:AAA family ATPase [Sphingobacterium lactis]|uniref:ATPase family associated with various cellular activities (AAA) n=1 Tax=Sphingobacterium lactis TaxID=797291 RepID=A0A1H5U1V1_9SPHI|nr:ATP-binding protein [Sphingobacterium lactis]SEF69112.1 ATPase family associated with various cellular activities (AAA) [Sphingobacterium lactis]
MNIQDLIIKDKEQIAIQDVFLSEENRAKIEQLIKEHRYVSELKEYGLPVTNKVILFGSSGCGKTTTAKAIANTLDKNLIILNLSNVINSKIGETSQNVKQVFDRAARDKAVLFLDEFDQLGKARGEDDNDVGEMRRLVNSIIQQIDYLPDDVLLICATNHVEIIDHALMRRFQVRIHYAMPDQQALDAYYDTLLARFPEELHPQQRVYGLSFAEAKDNLFAVVKSNLIKKLDMKGRML